MPDTIGLPSRHEITRWALIFALGAGFLTFAQPLAAQDSGNVQLPREAATTTETLEAIENLTSEIETNPSPEAYLALGLAHADLLQYDRALELFGEAGARYPSDSRFLAETANIHIAERNIDSAVEALERALIVDPSDAYAADLLASIRMSEGGVEEALAVWNSIDQPRIDNIFQNFSPGFLDRATPRGLTFDSGDVLTYEQWQLSEERLFATRMYANVGLEIEPSPAPDLYNAIVRTTARTNSPGRVMFGLVRGLPIQIAYFDLNDLGNSGIGWLSSYRWDADRRRLEGRVIVPLPLPGLPVIEFFDTWRSERWDLSIPLGNGYPSDARFDYKVNSFGLDLRVIPHYKAEIRGGFEYRNRDVTGTIPGLGLDERNSATLKLGTVLRPLTGRYRNQIRANVFIARESILGHFDFSGGSIQLANRVYLDNDDRTTLDLSLAGGVARGELPIDHYFVLGLGSVTDYPLRAHVSSGEGHYGRSPTGTDFVLVNTDIRHRLVTVPLFDTLGIPFVQISAMAFYDSARVFDHQRVLSQEKWFHDVGAGLRFETPTTSFTALYGRDTTGGRNAFYGYVEQRFW